MATVDVTQSVVDESGKAVEGGQVKQLLKTAVLAANVAPESKVEHFELWFKLQIHDHVTQPVIDFTEKELTALKKAVTVFSTFIAGQLHYILSNDPKKIAATVEKEIASA